MKLSEVCKMRLLLKGSFIFISGEIRSDCLCEIFVEKCVKRNSIVENFC